MSFSTLVRFFLSVAFIGLFIHPASAQRERQLAVESDPEGASVRILEGHRSSVGNTATTPGVLALRSSRELYIVEFSKEGFESRRVEYDYRNERNRTVLEATLPPLEVEPVFEFTTVPEGATVLIDGEERGVTPLQTAVSFSRDHSRANWTTASYELRLNDYESVTGRLEQSDEPVLEPVELKRLAIDRTFHFEVATEDDLPLLAELSIEGGSEWTAPASVSLRFARPTSDDPWPEFRVRAEIKDEFLPEERLLKMNSPSAQLFVLHPVTEIPVVRYFPSVESAARGPRPTIDMSAPLGTLDTRDLNSPAIDLRPITNFTRDQQMLQGVNSFCLTPDGQQLVYSVTLQSDDGSYYANLFIKSASDQSFAFQQLTRGNRFLDTKPVMSREEGSNLIVFQSNRGPVDSWDISSMRLRDGRIVGGIQQVTRDSRLNYGPSLTSEALPAHFTSSETFPNAQAFISHSRIDGSSFTNLGETGMMINRAEDGTIYFVRRAEDTGKSQIYSVTAEGLSFSSVINDMEFARSNVHSPNIHPDGSRLLFVSDYHQDSQGRHNNSIFLFDRETSRIQQITDNASDDLQPQWSPTESGVIYFLSNRGGVYNVWRLRMVSFD